MPSFSITPASHHPRTHLQQHSCTADPLVQSGFENLCTASQHVDSFADGDGEEEVAGGFGEMPSSSGLNIGVWVRDEEIVVSRGFCSNQLPLNLVAR